MCEWELVCECGFVDGWERKRWFQSSEEVDLGTPRRKEVDKSDFRRPNGRLIARRHSAYLSKPTSKGSPISIPSYYARSVDLRIG